ncbi:MAG: polysaccharide deacetylase family protein [Candidatus Methanomethyliaceae archaeon]
MGWIMQKVLVLAYHRVYPGYHIDLETFDYQMRVLKENYVPLSLDEVHAFVKGGLRLNRDGVCITFDDGWADNFVYAYPILKKHGLKATVFVSTSLIRSETGVRPTLCDYWLCKISYSDLFRPMDMDYGIRELIIRGSSDQFMTWQELEAMKDTVSVESHGHSHACHFISPKVVGVWNARAVGRPRWLVLSGEDLPEGATLYEFGSVLAWPRYYPAEKRTEALVDFVSRVRAELERSIAIIEAHLGVRPSHLSWPFGEYAREGVRLARELGFQSAYLTRQGDIRRGSDCYALPRFSPPRNRKAFLMALRGTQGMLLYNSILFGLGMWQKVKTCIHGLLSK